MLLQWRHNGCDSVSNHQPHDCLLNRLFRCRSKKTSKLRITGLCAGNSPGTSEFPSQMASNEENVTIWWRHHAMLFSLFFFLPRCFAAAIWMQVFKPFVLKWNILQKHEKKSLPFCIISCYWGVIGSWNHSSSKKRIYSLCIIIPWLFMFWWLQEPIHQQPWYWPSSFRIFWSQHQKG